MQTSEASSLPGPQRFSSDAGVSGCHGWLLIRRQRKIRANWPEVEEFLHRAANALAPLPFTVCIVSDHAMCRFNLDYRKQDKATDVLSFPAGKKGKGSHGYLGDIVISAETARRKAALNGLRVEDEIKTLILHGLLHLLGYDHERDQGQMARRERLWGERLGLPQTLLSGARKASGRAALRNLSRRRAMAGKR